MAGYVFLVKKDNLYLIGSARNMERHMSKISPDEIIESIEIDYPRAFLVRLLRRFKIKETIDRLVPAIEPPTDEVRERVLNRLDRTIRRLITVAKRIDESLGI